MIRMYKTWPRLLLPHLPIDAPRRALEIGLWKGDTAEWMLRNVLNREEDIYVGIDPWNHIGFQQGSEAVLSDSDGDAIYQGVLKRLKPWAQRALVLRCTTEDVLNIDPWPIPWFLHGFDLVFIDGMHTREWVLRDSHFAWSLLQPGGVMIWDDYAGTATRKTQPHAVEVAGAVHEFLNGKDSSTYEFLWQDKQYAVKKLE